MKARAFFRNAGLILLSGFVLFGFAACGEEDVPACATSCGDQGPDFEDISFDSAGLQPDPLDGLSWPALPDDDDVPNAFKSDVKYTVSGDRRLLMFIGETQDEKYVYRAPVLDTLNDEEFQVAVPIMATRTDRMGMVDHGPSNGGSDGDGNYFHMRSYVYDPDSTVVDPDSDFDLSANQARLNNQVDDGLDDTTGLHRDGDDNFHIELTFQPTIRSWQHYVDVLNPDEVATRAIAETSGKNRKAQLIDLLIDSSTDGVDNVTGCTEVDRSAHGHRALYACSESQAMVLPDLAQRIINIRFLKDGEQMTEPDDDGPQNSASPS